MAEREAELEGNPDELIDDDYEEFYDSVQEQKELDQEIGDE